MSPLLRLFASWIFTNLLYMVSSPHSFLTLEYVRRISLRNFLLVWLFFYLLSGIPSALNLRGKKLISSLAPCAGLCLAVLLAGGVGMI